MRRLVLVGLLVAACGSSEGARTLSKLESLTEAMCACQDRSCSNNVYAKILMWERDDYDPKWMKATTSSGKTIQDLAATWRDCKAALERDRSDPLPKADELVAAMCACKDSACVERVDDDLRLWSKNRDDDAATRARIQERMQRYAKCRFNGLHPKPEELHQKKPLDAETPAGT